MMNQPVAFSWNKQASEAASKLAPLRVLQIPVHMKATFFLLFMNLVKTDRSHRRLFYPSMLTDKKPIFYASTLAVMAARHLAWG
jgi:hypothetical protein